MLRHLERHRAFVFVAAPSLGIGMAVATAVVSVAFGIPHAKAPFPAPDELVFVYETLPRAHVDMDRVPARHFMALRDQATSLRGVAAWEYEIARVTGGEQQSLTAARVTANFFTTLRARPALGRLLSSDGADADRDVVMSHVLWQSRYGGDTAIVGSTIMVNGQRVTVAGVTERSFDFPKGVRLWFLKTNAAIASEAAARDNQWPSYYTFGRLAPRATVIGASSEAATIYRRTFGDSASHRYRSSRMVPLHDYLVSDVGEQLELWIAAAIVIALLCAVNFATMSLGRGMRRRGELAVRAAIGASRLAVARMLVLESLAIALIGGAMAVLLAAALLGVARRVFSDGGVVVSPNLNLAAVAFGVVGTALVGGVFALAPALELAKIDLRTMLTSDAGGSTTRGGELSGRRLLVALQLALALAAVGVVAAVIQSDRTRWWTSAGVNYERLLVVNVAPEGAAIADLRFDPVVQALESTPGVSGVSVMGATQSASAWLRATKTDAQFAWVADVSPSYFQTLGVRVIAGRSVSQDELRTHAPVVVLAQPTAIQLFGSVERAVGRQLWLRRSRDSAQVVTIAGVANGFGGSALYRLSAGIYTMQDRPSPHGATLVIRTVDESGERLDALKRVITRADPRLMVTDARSGRELVEMVRGPARGRAIFLSTVATLAFALSVIGVYGLTSYTTELRAREIGIRVALGARPRQLVRVVYADLLWMAPVGIALGVAASSAATSFIDKLFFNPFRETALVTLPLVPLLASAAVLALIVMAATTVPVRRVLATDAMRAIQRGSSSAT